MPPQDYAIALGAYLDALNRLYAPRAGAPVERGAAQLAAASDLDERAQEVDERSAELGQAAAAERASPDPARRELAAIQRLAAAAADLAVANDLSLAAGGAVREVTERGSETGVPAEVLAILSVPPGAGLLGEAAAQRGGGPTDPRAARQALKEAVAAALDDIPRDAARAGQVAFVGLTEIPTPPLQEAAGLVFHDLMLSVSKGLSSVVRKAAVLVLRAVEKVITALGDATWAGLRDKVLDWIEDLKKGALLPRLLAPLYDLPRIRTEVERQIDAAGEGTPADAFNAAGAQLTGLSARFEKQKDVIEWVVRGLAWVRPWVLGLQPWGPLALTTTYVTLIGYAVCAGGDYVDWYRTGDSGRLDLVEGVRTIVPRALAGTAP